MAQDQQTLAQKVRAKYPDAYKDMDDATLEQKVLAKHPEYSDLPRTQAAPNLKTGAGMENYAQQQAQRTFTGTGEQGSYDATGRKVSGPSGEPLTLMEKAAQDQGARETLLGSRMNRAAQSPTPFTNASVTYAPAAAAKSILGAKLGSRAGGAIASEVSDSPEAEQYGELIGGAVGGSVPALPGGSDFAAEKLRYPATARQSQLGKPGTVKNIAPFQKYAVPEWLIPKGQVGSPTNPGPFMEIPARMPRGAGGPLGGRTSVLGGGGSESAARPSGNLILTPSEAQSEAQLGRIAKQRASERGMQFAGGMVPREGRSVPQTPTRFSDPEYSGVRERVPLTPLPGAEPAAPTPLLGQGQFSSANKAGLAQRSPAMDVPEWMQGQRGMEMQRLQNVLRNPKATPEERAIAQSQIDDYSR